jgi:serine/threonine protein kinase
MTLGDCMGMGRLAVGEALRISLQLAEAIRRIHDEGRIHGALTPDVIDLAEAGIQVLPAGKSAAEAITAYTAPEVIAGQTPDVRADIFAFGAILYEMVMGQRAFNGEREAPPSVGNAVLDKVIRTCVAKDLNTRVPQIQRVMLELKLAAVAARKVESAESLRREKAATRDHLQELEARLDARLAAQAVANELALDELRRSNSESNESLREQIALLCSELVATQERLAEATAVPVRQQVAEAIAAPIEEVSTSLKALGERMAALKQTVDDMGRRAQQFENRTTSELLDLGRTVKSNTLAIETAQKGQAQNEELLERVIDTLEQLQSDVLPEATLVEEEALLVR